MTLLLLNTYSEFGLLLGLSRPESRSLLSVSQSMRGKTPTSESACGISHALEGVRECEALREREDARARELDREFEAFRNRDGARECEVIGREAGIDTGTMKTSFGGCVSDSGMKDAEFDLGAGDGAFDRMHGCLARCAEDRSKPYVTSGLQYVAASFASFFSLKGSPEDCEDISS
jgi:hypothetical protein